MVLWKRKQESICQNGQTKEGKDQGKALGKRVSQ
jgi:hypothetical protein